MSTIGPVGPQLIKIRRLGDGFGTEKCAPSFKPFLSGVELSDNWSVQGCSLLASAEVPRVAEGVAFINTADSYDDLAVGRQVFLGDDLDAFMAYR